MKALGDAERVEFSNNGLLDSLTGTPAPKTFLDNLDREISKSKRKFQAISIITLKLLPESSRDSISKYEKGLVAIGQSLKSDLRSGDFYSRFAENGFWLCLQGDLVEAKKAADRFLVSISKIKSFETKPKGLLPDGQVLPLPKGPQIAISIKEWDGKSNSAEWIQEIDLCFFTDSRLQISTR